MRNDQHVPAGVVILSDVRLRFKRVGGSQTRLSISGWPGPQKGGQNSDNDHRSRCNLVLLALKTVADEGTCQLRVRQPVGKRGWLPKRR